MDIRNSAFISLDRTTQWCQLIGSVAPDTNEIVLLPNDIKANNPLPGRLRELLVRSGLPPKRPAPHKQFTTLPIKEKSLYRDKRWTRLESAFPSYPALRSD